jgi:hypothetical protein
MLSMLPMMRVVAKRVLLVAAGLVVALMAFAIYASFQIRATPTEKKEELPGDELIPQPIGTVTDAITIVRPARNVWPWLVQMGAGRAGWYGYDFIDNGGHPSADRILAEYQNAGVGCVMPAVPGVRDVFRVVRLEPERDLVLSWEQPNGRYRTTWAFVLEQPRQGQTRLVVRGRVAEGYRPFGLPQWLAIPTGRVAHLIMERKQLLGIKRRVEQ